MDIQKPYLILKMHLIAVIQKYQYAKSQSVKINSQRLMDVDRVEDICDYAAT